MKVKVKVKIRRDNERGLFATDNIKKGEFVCILPIDYFQLDNNWYATDFHSDQVRINFRYGIICEIIQNGLTQHESFSSFIKNKNYKCCLNALRNKILEIIGVSNPDKLDDNFLGHMINDYVDMSFLSENAYEKMSKEFSNVKVSSKLQLFGKRIGLKIIATKDTKKENELYLSYGSEYWKKYSKKERFVYLTKVMTFE